MVLFLSLDAIDEVTLPSGVDGVELRIFEKQPIQFPIDLNTIIAYKCDWDPQFLTQILSHKPYAIDFDYSVGQEKINWIKEKFPQQKVVVSYHDFDKTPDDLCAILDALPRADVYKLACMANSSLDALRMMQLVDENVIGISMGPLGQISRILAPVFGAPWNYTCITPVAPGQMSIDELTTYNYHNLSPQTEMYALIGDPVEKSRSQITHNQIDPSFVYVKVKLASDEVKKGIESLRQLGFKGCSVTTPHKLSFTNEPINTIAFEKELKFYNTDGMAARDLLAPYLPGASVLILGKGATARAIASALNHRCDLWGRNDPIPNQSYDIVIQATSAEFKGEILDFGPFLKGGETVLEVVSDPYETQFIQLAKKLKCHIIDGAQLFAQQAALQFSIWRNSPVDKYRASIEKMWHTERYDRPKSRSLNFLV